MTNQSTNPPPHPPHPDPSVCHDPSTAGPQQQPSLHVKEPPSSSSSSAEWMAGKGEDITIDYDETSDVESLWGDSSALSMATSLTHWRIENDRKYHTYRDGSYWAPHDEQALKMDNYAHHLWLLTLSDRLFLAPLKNPERAIDIGTGIGIWAQNFADMYPNAEVIGTDLSPIQGDYPAVNLRFETDDCRSEWLYPPDYFDYIHVRMLYGSLEDWPAFYKECMVHLKPGGWIEHSEINPDTKSDDGTTGKGDPFYDAGEFAHGCTEMNGKSLVIQADLKQMIMDAGFVNVVEHYYKWPIGDWPADPRLKELGIINARHWLEGIEGWTMRLMTTLYGWTPEQLRNWCQKMRNSIQSRKHHVYQPVSLVYAQKPLK